MSEGQRRSRWNQSKPTTATNTPKSTAPPTPPPKQPPTQQQQQQQQSTQTQSQITGNVPTIRPGLGLSGLSNLNKSSTTNPSTTTTTTYSGLTGLNALKSSNTSTPTSTGGGLGGLSSLSRLNKPTNLATATATTTSSSLSALSNLPQSTSLHSTASSTLISPSQTMTMPDATTTTTTAATTTTTTVTGPPSIDTTIDSTPNDSNIDIMNNNTFDKNTNEPTKPLIRYVTADEMAQIIPSFDNKGNILDSDGNILELLPTEKTPASQNTKQSTKSKSSSTARPSPSSTTALKQTQSASPGTLTQLDQDNNDNEVVIDEKKNEKKVNIYDTIQLQLDDHIADRFRNTSSTHTSQPVTRRRGFIGKTVDPTKALIQRNYEILTDIKKNIKKRSRQDDENDLLLYRASVDYKQPLWGMHGFEEDNIDDYIDSIGGIVQLEKMIPLQQKLHPFEACMKTIEPLFTEVSNNNTNDNNTQIQKSNQNNTSTNLNGNDLGLINNNDNNNITNNTNNNDIFQPYEWWDLKMLSTGTKCIELFQNELQQQLQKIQQSSSSQMSDIDDNSNNNNNNDDNSPDVGLVFVRPSYPPFDPITSTFKVSTNNINTSSNNGDANKMNDDDNNNTTTNNKNTSTTTNKGILFTDFVKQEEQHRQDPSLIPPPQWPFSEYIGASTIIPKTMYIPKYVAPISTVQSLIDKNENTTLQLPLTRQELKKERRLRRKQRREEEELLIKAGVIPKPPQKMRLVTLYRQMTHFNALGIATEFELAAKQQIQERLNKHIETNLSNMLTPQQVKEKRLKKILQEQDNIKSGNDVLITKIYRCGTLNNPITRKNIILNATQQRLSGVMICCKDIVNIVIVQGGERGHKKFQRYMLHRAIYQDVESNKDKNGNNHDDDDNNDQNNDDEVDNKNDHDDKNNNNNNFKFDPHFGRSPHYNCIELWSGALSAKANNDDGYGQFVGFHVTRADQLTQIKTLLKSHSMVQFFDLVTKNM